MRKISKMDVLRLVLVLSLVAGAGLALGAVGRFTPTHRIVEPVYCGSCHSEQVQELSATTHLAHFSQAIYEGAYDENGGNGTATKPSFFTAEAISGGCMMCHNTWANRDKVFVTNYSLTDVVAPDGTGVKNSVFSWNSVTFKRTNESSRYGIIVDTYGNQDIDLVDPTDGVSPDAVNSSTIKVKVASETYALPGLAVADYLKYGTDFISDNLKAYTLNTSNALSTASLDSKLPETGLYLLAGSKNVSELDDAQGTVDVEYQAIEYVDYPVTTLGTDQPITITDVNQGTVVVTVQDPATSGLPKGMKLIKATDFTTGVGTVTLTALAANVSRLSDTGGSVRITYETTTAETLTGILVDITSADQEVELSTGGVDPASIQVFVLTPGTSGVDKGTPLVVTTDWGLYPTSGTPKTGIELLAGSAIVDALNQGDGTIRVLYNVSSPNTASLKEVWGALSAKSPQDGVFISDADPAESCGNVEKGYCHAAEVALGKNLLNKMPENKLGVSGSGIFYQHEMAYTSGEYAAKQVKFCGVCHVNKLPPMTPDGEPTLSLIVGSQKITRISHGRTFTSDPSITSKDWAHKMVQCVRCHGHAGIGASTINGGVVSN